MPYILRNKETSCLKQKVIINLMKSVFINPRDKKEFDKSFSLLIEFGKERKRLTLDEDDDISFVFLMKSRGEEVHEKVISKKSA